MTVQEIRFALDDAADGARVLAELHRHGYVAWMFRGERGRGATLIAEAEIMDTLALEAIVRTIDERAVVVRRPGWDPLAGS